MKRRETAAVDCQGRIKRTRGPVSVVRPGKPASIPSIDLPANPAEKIRPLEELSSILAQHKAQGRKVVLCHGVFDLLHLGHMRHLNSAKKFGDVLVVSATADHYVKRGPGRPVFSQEQRAETLANLSVVDYVTITHSATAIELIQGVRPNAYVKGPDYKNRKPQRGSRLDDEAQTIRSVGGKIVFTEDDSFSSSELINKHFSTFPETTNAYLRQLAGRYSLEDVRARLEQARKLKILVVGDSIIDQYCYCTPLGKSAKENMVAHRYLREESYAGGALATANHVAQMCDSVELVTFIGEHDSYEDLIRQTLDPRIQTTLLRRAGARTTVKRRFVSDDNRKAFEVCYIDDSPLAGEEENGLLTHLETGLDNYDLVVVNDFGHGMLTRTVRGLLTSRAKKLALNVQTNSANHGFNLITNYARADFACIDEVEARLATRDRFSEVRDLVERLYRAIGASHIVVTRGSKGSLSFTPTDGFLESPALTSFGVDKVGAGDAFFAFASSCFAAEVPPDLLAFIGNVVGALKLQIVGNKESVKWPDVMKFITRLLKV